VHELSIAASILETLRVELEARPGVRASSIGLRVGVLSGVDPESLRFGFDALVADTPLYPLQVHIDLVARRQRCLDCTFEYDVFDHDSQCPACSSLLSLSIAGDELDIAWIEVEEPCLTS
jgi:hydrogenase nickel incorporation protein HypA/HybF